MNERIEHIIPRKYLDPYNQLISDLDRLRSKESNAQVDKAFMSLIELCANKSSIYNRDIILTVLNSARIAVNEIGLGRTSVISLFIYHSLAGKLPDLAVLASEYDETIALITEGLLKVGQIDETTTSSQAENFRRFLLNLARDVRVILIRLAEQTELMREMRQFSPEIQIRLASEASFLYAPLAHRLGLYLIKSEMEDLALKYTDRANYDLIAKKLAETMRVRKSFIDEFIGPVGEALEKQGFIFDIKGRPKSIYSIWNKMQKKGVEFEDIYDLFAIRIILRSELKNEKADCWQVYSTVTDIYQPNPQRMRDWISIPKTNGYESLHTTVIGPGGRWVEVQIRTERMNEIAEKGVAAHWKYKGLEGEHGIDNWLGRVREILDSPETDAGNFIDDFKLSLYSKEIFVFTPKGDLRKFPDGATILDFAYDIHTDVGSACTGARVNGRTVPIRYRMKNGDKIEVLTSKSQNPNLDWLNFVVTSKAQKKIRQKLNEELAKEAENGKEIIKRRFKNWKIEFSDENIRKLLRKFKYPNAQEFYYLVSNEKIDLAEIKEFLSADEIIEEADVQSVEELETGKKSGRKEERSEDYLIIDEKIDNIDYKLAKCCSPIMGDHVFGFVTVSEGIKIHRTNCPNAVQLVGKYGYRVVRAKWTRKGPESVFPVNIRVTGEDYAGILKSISEAITKDLKLNVRSITMDTTDGMIGCKISIMVRDIEHLDNLIFRISSIKGIYSASRYEGN
jgi:GTP diphosphokinase / guanosine-3',5'-bis(diphosphate) 3'-diphosphatase